MISIICRLGLGLQEKLTMVRNLKTKIKIIKINLLKLKISPNHRISSVNLQLMINSSRNCNKLIKYQNKWKIRNRKTLRLLQLNKGQMLLKPVRQIIDLIFSGQIAVAMGNLPGSQQWKKPIDFFYILIL